jgi:hypothetical protein
MNFRCHLLALIGTAFQVTFAASALAQSIAYESFAGIPVGSGLAGSGSTATGWTDLGWTNGGDSRFRVVNPIPGLNYAIAGGAFLDGSDRAVQLTTNPEPVPVGLLASRTFPEQNTTVYFSFLVRPIFIGTGSDTLSLRLSNGVSSLALVALQPDVGQQFFNLTLLLDGGSGGVGALGSQALYPSTTYLIAGRITWQIFPATVETWINPPAAYPGNGSQTLTKFELSGPSVFNSIGFAISSTDSGGPTSTAIFDELRIGYTWADVVPPSPITTLGNISTRGSVETGDNVLIGGFIISGTQPKKVTVRAIGPSLPLGGALADPTLELHDDAGTLIAINDNWTDSINRQEIIDSTIPPTNDLESAILGTFDPGAYTAIVSGVSNTTGIALVEAYDLGSGVDSKLANISTRGLVQTGDNVLIGGFILLGPNAQQVIVRAIGPSLPVAGKLADPTLDLYDANGVLLASNDNWRDTQEAEILATMIPPPDDAEAAIVQTLAPAAYTAIVRGKNGTSGVALVEVYALETSG